MKLQKKSIISSKSWKSLQDIEKLLEKYKASTEQKQRAKDAKIVADYCATNQIIFKEDIDALMELILNS